MTTLQSLARLFWTLNLRHNANSLKQYKGYKPYTYTAVYYSVKKSNPPPEESKVDCKKESKSTDVCVKAETLQVLSQKEPVDPIPKDCGQIKPDPVNASLRPYVNHYRPHPTCDPCNQPVHPCREKPPRIPVIQDGVKTELSLKTKTILLALSAVIGGIIIYKVLTRPDDGLAGGKKRPRCVLRPQYITKTPEYKEEIPKEAPYLIVGGGTASFSAFRTIKSLDPTAKIMLITSEPYNPYMRPPLATDLITSTDRALSRELRIPTEVKGESRSIFFEPDDFFTSFEDFDENENGGITVIKGWTVASVDPVSKTVKLQDGPTVKYNKCLLATGSRAKNLGVFDCNTEDVAAKVTAYRTVYDYLEIEDVIACGAQKIAIVGSNNIACELATSLASRGLEVIQIFKEDGVMAHLLPKYLSEWVTQKIEKQGVTIMKNTVLEDAVVSSNKLKLITKERKGILIDHTIVVSGTEPNTDLAKPSGIEVDCKRGGFVANTELQVRRDLYAAGDCLSFYDSKLARRRRLENHDHAIATGRIAGENMAGGKAYYDKESTFWSAIMPGVEFESIGEVNSELPTVAVFLDKENVKTVVDIKHSKIEPNDDYNRGVLFYLNDKSVVGIALWNLMGRVPIAQRILRANVPYEHLDDSTKLLFMHRP